MAATYQKLEVQFKRGLMTAFTIIQPNIPSCILKTISWFNALTVLGALSGQRLRINNKFLKKLTRMKTVWNCSPNLKS